MHAQSINLVHSLYQQLDVFHSLPWVRMLFMSVMGRGIDVLAANTFNAVNYANERSMMLSAA